MKTLSERESFSWRVLSIQTFITLDSALATPPTQDYNLLLHETKNGKTSLVVRDIIDPHADGPSRTRKRFLTFCSCSRSLSFLHDKKILFRPSQSRERHEFRKKRLQMFVILLLWRFTGQQNLVVCSLITSRAIRLAASFGVFF